MQIINSHGDCLGYETYTELGFKSEEQLNREILKLIQFRSEFAKNAEAISIK